MLPRKLAPNVTVSLTGVWLLIETPAGSGKASAVANTVLVASVGVVGAGDVDRPGAVRKSRRLLSEGAAEGDSGGRQVDGAAVGDSHRATLDVEGCGPDIGQLRGACAVGVKVHRDVEHRRTRAGLRQVQQAGIGRSCRGRGVVAAWQPVLAWSRRGCCGARCRGGGRRAWGWRCRGRGGCGRTWRGCRHRCRGWRRRAWGGRRHGGWGGRCRTGRRGGRAWGGRSSRRRRR